MYFDNEDSIMKIQPHRKRLDRHSIIMTLNDQFKSGRSVYDTNPEYYNYSQLLYMEYLKYY